MSNPTQRLFADAQRLLLDAQRLFSDASSASNMFTRSAMNAGTSISQAMGNIGTPREFSGFPATNILETPEIYELQSEIPGVDKDNINIEVPDSHTLTIIGRVQEDGGSTKKEDKMEEDSISPVAAETHTDSTQPQDVQSPSIESSATANVPPSASPKAVQISKKPAWWTNERVLGSFGSFRRSFFFLDPITADGATATLKSGVVKIVLHKVKDLKSDVKPIQLED
ncbi:heat shock protein 30 [Mucor ambiguus]|uniref:Heat shock protein 30 n=1 Tax=Mucor ambiguus TaxID=91626 RepID=A0A0C9M2K2_9FUNG|nr:heat shock protein 30 [Mucor ambiguus]